MSTYLIKSLYVIFVVCAFVFLKSVSPQVHLFDKLTFKYNDNKIYSCGLETEPRCASKVNSKMSECKIEGRAYWTSKEGFFLKYDGLILDVKERLVLCGFNIIGADKSMSLAYEQQKRNIILLILLFIAPIFFLTAFNKDKPLLK